jgi:hypothetical protein
MREFLGGRLVSGEMQFEEKDEPAVLRGDNP